MKKWKICGTIRCNFNETISSYGFITRVFGRMNTTPAFTDYYDRGIRFAEFSKAHENWTEEIDRNGITDIVDYYDRVKAWYRAL